MKVFSKIRHTIHTLGSERVEVRTHYFLFDWNFYTSKRLSANCEQPSAEWMALRQDSNGQLEVDEQCQHLGII